MKLLPSLLPCLLALKISSGAKAVRRSSLTGKAERRLAMKWAPIVYLAKNDPFRPSSVSFFLKEVKMVDENGTTVKQPQFLNKANLPVGKPSYYLTTKEALQCPTCTLPFHKGQDICQNSVPVYALYRHTQNSTLEITYWFFYPYNLGKVVCVGYRFRNYCPLKCRLSEQKACYQMPNKDCPCACEKINICVGTEQTFGNHVGDWERVTIRFLHCKATRRYEPLEMYLAIHHFGRLFKWTGKEFRSGGSVIHMKHGHPVVYSTYGSHGTWPQSGQFVYYKACNGELLTDHTSPGREWQTWRNLQVIPNLRDSSKYRGRYSFLKFRGMWGNKESGCKIKSPLKICALTDGPPSITVARTESNKTSLGALPPCKGDVCKGKDNSKRENGWRVLRTFDVHATSKSSTSSPSSNGKTLNDISSYLLSFIPKKAPNEALSPFWDELRKEAMVRLATQCKFNSFNI